MRMSRLLMGMAMVVALTGCAGDRDADGGGGGGDGQWEPTHDRSNPISREQENKERALPLNAVPQGGQATFGEGVEDPKTMVVSRDGQPAVKVDVNSATMDQLLEVPGMSANLAEAIIYNRPYRNMDDLAKRIPNLDPRLVKSYAPYLSFGAAPKR